MFSWILKFGPAQLDQKNQSEPKNNKNAKLNHSSKKQRQNIFDSSLLIFVYISLSLEYSVMYGKLTHIIWDNSEFDMKIYWEGDCIENGKKQKFNWFFFVFISVLFYVSNTCILQC